MDVSRGISIEEAKGLKLEETWLPVTPGKPIPTKPQGSHNWYDAAPRGIKLPTEFVQGTPNASNFSLLTSSISANHHSQFHNWESPAFSGKSSTGNGNTLWNSLPFSNLLALASEASGAPADSNSGAPSCPTLPFSLPNNAKFAANMVMEHMYKNQSNQRAPYGFPLPYASAPTTMYHLNSSPTTFTIPDAVSTPNLSLQSASKNTHTGMYTRSPPVMGSAVQDNWIYLEAMSNGTTSSLFAPLTPQKQHQLVNGNEKTSYLESSQVQLSTPSNQNQDPEPHKLSAPLKENHLLETEEENRIDLNKTPQQKQQKPRRKKHRPRVVTEKKPRAPKSAAEKKDVKRKYVRRRVNSSSTPSAYVAGKEPNRCITPRSCKRSLNFDQQSQTHEGHGKIPIQQEKDVAGETKEPNRCITPRSCKRSLNFDQQSQTHEGHGKMPIQQEKETFQILNNTLDVALHPNYSATQMFGEHIPLPQSTTFPTRRELLRKNLEVLGRNEQEFSAIVDCQNTVHPQLNAHAPFNPKKVYEGMLQGSEDVKKGVMLFPHIYKKRRTMSKASKSYGATVANGQSEVIGHYKKNNATSDKMMCFELVSSIRQPEVKTRKRTKGHTRARDLATLTSIVQCNSMMSTKARYSRKEANGNSFSKATFSRKKSNGNSFSSENDTRVQELVLHGHRHYSAKSRDALKVVQQIKSPIEDLLQRLNLVSGVNEQNALVPFKGDDRIVPYESKLDPFNKKRSRAKVELDSETDRVWKLLMGKEASEGAEGTDVDKEKWWEEERRIFRGRAESFIARMHLIQGDRRFSKWNGSVLDSVIGVFLTQNVSDHLSSSAFISLAAKFPAKRTSNDEMCHEEETRMWPEEPEIEVLQSDNINWHENMRYEPIIRQDSQGSVILNDADCIEEKEMGRITEVESYSVSPQNSIKSSLFQVMEDSSKWPANKKGEIIKSCSDSNSEEEDPSTMCKLNCPSSCVSFTELLHTSIFQECYNSANECLSINLNSNIQSKTGTCKQPYLDTINAQSSVHPSSLGTPHNCFLPATSDTGFLEVQCPEIGSSQGTREITEQSTPLDTQAAAIGLPCSSLNKQSVDPNTSFEQEVDPLKQLNSWGNSVSKNDQIYLHHEGNQSSKPEIHDARSQKTDAQKQPVGSNSSNVSGETVEVVESSMLFNKKYSRRSGNVESVTKEQVHSSSSPNEKTVNASKPNGKKPKEKQKVIDWDNLRKEAYKQYGKRERTSDTMDSVDWEAVRLADVNVIADCIKARGMNNMLAERIKDFLNRLVREHESVDLEWLRDVHPDKVKEYLLSVRGLGLKSVECIRLLTLHHLAFPVDTNVGRIAVRLGWVPLQQLPESLQLHLLEMYPIQESIQKYLWPRLCTLDQLTLYNLHYHMITFGKVFCTKNKPNCNACVMRAECRHFASAFASARLALPGPEEKGIVSLTVPPIPHESESVTINPTLALPPQEKGSVNSAVPNYSTEVGADKMPPPPLEVNMQSETGTILANSEPIIEVPASPEPECNEILGSDIEDAFWEDPDEIPTIKLNIENFTFNLQNYMQENNIELQDGDMSKSLVTLNPEAASIPTPKLKNVGRLRTEHQVYELPDSHPLLEGVERRVPGEVCSYLLAIWTPGETAESTQPPQRCCDSQISGNNICTEKTCLSCNIIREANSQTVRGTLLIPCKTAMRGSFPLNGTYFQVNEVFADHDSSLNPIDVPRSWLWNLSRRTVYFGTSIPTIFRGQSTEQIQSCFWKGYVCVRGFERKTRAPRPLMARLHFPASRLAAREKSKRHQ